MADVFLSYRRDDAAAADTLVHALRQEGIDVWWDRDIPPSAPWEAAIERSLEQARAVVVCWSPSSVASDNVRAEARRARDSGRLVQTFVEPCTPPLFFSESQGIDLAGWSGDRKDPRFRSLVEAVRALNDAESPAEAAASRAPAPELARPRGMIAAASAKARAHRLALAAAAVLLVLLAGAWLLLGPRLMVGPQDRIPIVVQALAASGSGDRTEAALAGGITDELIVRLRRIPGLRIATADAGGTVTSGAFARAHVVSGTVRSAGNALKVTVRLSRANGEILWSQTFDRNLVDLLAVQEAIAANIAGALSVPLDVGATSVAHGGTSNPEAYAAFVRGRLHQLDFDQSAAVRYFEEAIALDPGFVQAHAQLAATYGNRIWTARTKAELDRLVREMDAASAAALKSNPRIWNSAVARGWYYLTIKDLAATERMMQRAAALDKGIDPELRAALAQYAVTVGRSRKALSIINSRALIDPIYEHSREQIFFLMMSGRHRESTELYERLAKDEQQNLQAWTFHVFWARVLADGEDEAIAWANGLNVPPISTLAAQLRDFERNRDLIAMDLPQVRRWARERHGDGGQLPLVHTALAAAYRGHQRLAVDLLRVAYERPGGYTLFNPWHPAMAEARKTDAFEQLAIDLGFVKAWRQSGDWGDFCRPVEAGRIACN
jgi:TolB-like protein